MPKPWLTANEIIELVNAVIRKNGTAAYPYFGYAHLYTGPRYEIHEAGKNILHYDKDANNNHKRAQFWAPLFGAKLIDDMNLSLLVLSDVNSSGLDIYGYFLKAFGSIDPKSAFREADRVMRYASKYFVDGLWGHVTTSVCGAARNRVFFDTEFPRLDFETVDLVTGLAKSKDIETVNGKPIADIRKLFTMNAVETAYRVVCIHEIDLLRRTAWATASESIMRHCLDVEEFYMVDRQQGWKVAAKELFKGGVPIPELIKLDRKLTRLDRVAKRSRSYCCSPVERFSQKEAKLHHFVTALAAGLP
ncbi:MAG: hypothetical protein ABTQ34_09900 [Bdellovibrionales bacterium]